MRSPCNLAVLESFAWSRGADALSRCDSKHGSTLEISPVTQILAFGLASHRRDQQNRAGAQPTIQRRSRQQKDRSLFPPVQPCSVQQVSRSRLAGVAVTHALARDVIEAQ